MTPGMGRPKTKWPDLPPRMTARELASGKVLYYYQSASKKIPLGADLNEARRKWAQLEDGTATVRFPKIAEKYRKATFEGFSESTKQHYRIALGNLEAAFEQFTLEQIEPKHIKLYIRRRSKKGAAVFEKRVLSAVFNWARGEGLTSAPNPCRGIQFSQTEKKSFEPQGKRDRYVTDAEFREVYDRGDEILQDTMDLALLTGQRPGDILKARRADIAEGVWWIVQQKTGKRVGIKVEGELTVVLERILTRPRPIQSVYLISDRRGQRVRMEGLGRRFRKARGTADWQFRDLRAKTASDSPDLKHAQRLLGHVNETTTAGVYRRAKGAVVAPLKRN